jgi:large-conductance mechanosensitive channel
LFLVVRGINRLTAPRAVPAPGEPPPPEDIRLLREIRDALVMRR